MACTDEFIESLCDMLAPLGEVRSRKMMGDYVVYLNDKCVITACDNTAYVKKLPCLDALMADAETGSPYPGAKEAWILDLSRPRQVLKVIEILWDALPLPKPRKKTGSK
ncbi:MAG: TfoX/Sxy family protein [Muribaculaceae bacterium]|nr:TfoX/Sxy family protein [Muribaculaceae bacterium]